jgi:RNA polymerase sigma-70 factor, ECF subfamily
MSAASDLESDTYERKRDVSEFSSADPAARWHALEACRDYLRLVVRRGRWSKDAGQAATSDLVQDTLVDAWRDFSRFRGGTPAELRGWLKAILVHASLNARRRSPQAQISCCSEVHALAGTTTSPSQAAHKNSAREELDKALDTLPERQRTVVRLRLWDRLSFARIGDTLGISEDAARMLYGRAIACLRGRVRPGHDLG